MIKLKQTAAVLLISMSVLLFQQACSKEQITHSLVTTAVSVATSTALKVAPIADARKALLKNYLCGNYANAVRSVAGNPTPENFLNQINAFIPQNVKDNYPELVTFANPLALQGFQLLTQQYGNDVEKIAAGLNDIATGIQLGACH